MILLAGVAAAQAPSSAQIPSDVTVIKINWRRVEPSNPFLHASQGTDDPVAALKRVVNTSRINEANSARDSGNPSPPKLLSVPSGPDTTPPTVRAWSGFVYEFTVKNTGEKIIRHIAFEYSFTDPRTQQTVGRREYKSKVKIRPGMTAKIVVRSSSRPLGTVSVAQAGRDPHELSPEQMVIQRIKYDDGSVWERSSN
jgi:hypothetical protein